MRPPRLTSGGLLLALALCACGREEPAAPSPAAAEAPQVAERAPPVAREVEGLSELELGANAALPEPLAQRLAARLPGADDWDSEAFSSAAGGRLKALAAWLEGDAPELPEDVLDWVAPDLALDALWWPGGEVDGLSAGLVVRRPQLPEARPAELLAALTELRGLARGARLDEVQFKHVGVALEGERARLEVVYQARGRQGERPLGQEAEWTLLWRTLDAAPQLVAVEVRAFEEVLGPESGPLFGEISEAALGGSRVWERQLGVGLETWAARLDRTLGVSLIGHHGIAVGDVDGDGGEDVYACQPAGLPNRLFLRRPGGGSVERAAEGGVDYLDASRAALLVDLDGDGNLDLALDLDPHLVLHAGDGAARFEPVLRTRAAAVASLSAADYDLDGDLDLYLCGYLEPDAPESSPLPYHDARNGQPNRLYRNDCGPEGWAFAEVTREVGLDVNNRRFSLAASWEDYDDDGDPDLYVANDFGRNNLYRNDGGRFSDVAAEAGVEDMAAGMGVTWGDHDQDGDLDLYVSNMFSSAGERVTYQRRFKQAEDAAVRAGYQRHARGNSLFENLGDGTFRDVTVAANVFRGRWAWGAIFTDLDGDGRRDLFVPNGFVTGADPEDL